MSYINMDHAAWVERQIAAIKQRGPNAAERGAAVDRRGWFAAPAALNPFQRRAFDILGIVGGGIYNATISWKSVRWSRDYIIVPWRNSLATFDFDQLTRLVLLCHEARIRAAIAPHGPGYLQIALTERAATGDMAQRHPSLNEMIAWWAKEFPISHSIHYREPAPPVEQRHCVEVA